MTEDPIDPSELEAAVTTVYRGPLEEFISRRDALAKQLRASKRADDAARVKALRKPGWTAWALDQVVLQDPAPVEQLAGAIQEAQDPLSQAAGAKAAQENVGRAVRDVAEAGARAAIRGKHPIASSVLVAAVRAVIGEAEAFAALRAGRLVDVPEGGGLDLLAAMSIGAAPPPKPAPAKKPDKQPARKEDDAAAVREELERAEASLTRARERAQAAERAALSAQARLEAAEEQLQRAQEQAKTRSEELERALQDASTAAKAADDAERAVADMRARVEVGAAG